MHFYYKSLGSNARVRDAMRKISRLFAKLAFTGMAFMVRRPSN